MVYEELRRLMLQIQLPELSRYYKLQSRIHDVMEGVLNSCLEPTNEMILNLIEIETSLINTNHPDFIGSADSLLNLFAEDQKEPQSESDEENEDQKFSLITKPQNQPSLTQSQQTAQSNEQKPDSARKGWMPSFFSRKQAEEPKAAEEQLAEKVVEEVKETI